MAQINLLKQKSPSQNFAEAFPSIAVKILALVFLAVCIYYGFLFYQARQISRETLKVQGEISAGKRDVAVNTDRDELLTRQDQVAKLSGLIAAHAYWSQLFPALAASTLQKSKYSEIKITKDGTVALTASVPDLIEFNKFLQIFDLPEFNANFFDVHVSSFAKVKNSDGTTSINFGVLMKFDPALIKYKAAADANKQ